MGYLDKENAIIKKLQETKYDMFDGDKDEALEFLDSQFGSFTNYANAVITQQQRQPILYARYEGQDLRDRLMEMDRQRHDFHECAIGSVNVLNRLSKNLGLPAFSDVDTKDRYAVADMVGDYVGELYKTGTKGMDGATLKRENRYDPKLLEERRRKAARLCEGIAEEPEQAGMELD